MSYFTNNESEKQNPIFSEESTIQTSTVTTVAAPISTTALSGSQVGTQQDFRTDTEQQIELSGNASSAQTYAADTQNSDGYHYSASASGESMLGVSDDRKPIDIVAAEGVGEWVFTNAGATADIQGECVAVTATAILAATTSQQQKGDNTSINVSAPKSNDNAATDVESVDLVGDCTRMPRFVKDTFGIGATTTATKATDSLLVSSATTTKPPIPPTPPTSPTSPTLPMSTSVATAQCSATPLAHTSSDPSFAVQSQLRRNQQQQKMKSYHDTKQTTMWSKDSVLGSSGSISIDATATALTSCTGAVIKSGTYSATVSPFSIRKSSDPNNVLPRRVSFPKSDNELVTGYLEPANPWGQACLVKSISEIAELYVMSCRKHKTKPLQTVLDHLKGVELNKQQRQPVLSLKSIKLAASDCEALEEIFKRVQYKFIDLSSCDLDEWATSALFEMIEYYEAAHELDISSNSKGMTMRGWAGCMAMVKHSEELRVLIAQGNPISKQSADGLGQAISASNLHTLKLEHCGLKGALDGLCFKLRHNTTLRELWLAHNDLDCKDAEALGDLLKVNHYLELIDISNNNIRDRGLLYIVEALILQSNELERRSMLQRSSAIDDDDSLSSVEASQTTDFDTSDSFSNSGKGSAEENVENSESDENASDKRQKHAAVDKSSDVFSTALATDKVTNNDNTLLQQHANPDVGTVSSANAAVNSKSSVVGGAETLNAVVGSLDEMDGDDDTEDTVKSSNHKNGAHAPSGQSMLDKLLSMNSESSSEEGASNLSTDTIAACGSEDASITSDDIFETSGAVGVASASAETQKSNSSTKAVGVVMAAHLVEGPTDIKVGKVKNVEEITLIDIASSDTDPPNTTSDNGSNGSGAEVVASNSNDQSENTSTTSKLSDDDNNSNNNTANSAFIDTSGNEDDCRHYKDSGRPLTQDQDNENQNLLSLQQPNAPNIGGVFEVTAGEGDCTIAEAPAAAAGVISGDRISADQTTAQFQQQLPSKALDVNKNTKLTDDYDDTHSTDSAFESASEGDISRHLPEEYSRLSSSFDGVPMDDIGKGVAIETGTIATESTEYLADAGVTPTSTPTPPSSLHTQQLGGVPFRLDDNADASCRTITPNTAFTSHTYASVVKMAEGEKSSATETKAKAGNILSDEENHENPLNELPALPKVTIASDNMVAKDKEALTHSPIPTPPPPSTSPGGASHGMRRTESSTTFITPATRHRSQSSDSLCSDNSLDGSTSSDLNFSTSSQLNEKLTKNDTLTRQQRQSDPRIEPAVKAPGGLKALALWNNNLSKEAGYYIAHLLAETNSLELLNIGKNCLSNDFVTRIKDSLIRNTTLTTLGLQSAHLSANGIETLASILTFGGNSTLQRLDIRDNKLEVESLTKIAEVLKSNTTITQIDIDDEPKRLSVGSEAHMDYTRVLENVRSMCSRNEKTQTQLQSDKSLNSVCGVANKRRSGYYLGSRKISLTCHTRPLVETTTTVMASSTTPTSAVNTKLDAKRKTGARLRSPVPSPPTISPSSSPNRSRFQVFRVTEVSPLTSPLAQTPPSAASSTSSLATNSNSSSISMPADMSYKNSASSIPATCFLPTSSSLPSMATVTSSTQSIKRFSASPRSRFMVSKIYEDPRVPLASRSLPPITPPIHLPPTPIAKHAPESAKLIIFSAAAVKPVATVDKKGVEENGARTHDLTAATITTASNSGGDVVSQISVVQATTLIVTPPTPAIAESSSNNSSTNILDFSQNVNLKKVDSTNATAQMQTQQTQQEEEQSQLQTQIPLQSKQIQDISSQSINAPTSTGCQNAGSNTTTTTSHNSNNNSLSPICSSSSSSSSTSPASLHSNSSSSTSTSSPLSAIFSTSSSDSTDGIGGSGAGAAGGELSLRDELLNATGTRCPLAVFNDNDNDITLTKSSTTELSTPPTSAVATEESQQRQRKVSWMANPGAVDKLRSLFFQRSSSPENKTQVPTAVTVAAIGPPTQAVVTNPTATIPSNSNNTTVAINNATAFNLSDCALTDASSQQQLLQKFVHASQQLSKVFRQNLSFGNEAATTTNTLAGITSVSGVTTGGFLSGGVDGNGTLPPTEQHDVTLIPTEVKQEIKENISPEHTINEETLHSLQKLTGIEVAVQRVQEQQQHQQLAAGAGARALLEDMEAAAVIIKPAILDEFNTKAADSNISVESDTRIGAEMAANLVKEEPTTASAVASNAAAST
ncbi:PREDICTED: serine-rich adhesin for platelets isoform X2 [Rhagoletis zephyria]|uniref:serine-rich adhesin for platelets isoform X2 n=1 Tax=Rhagoletis zephyria TaxID=28612 RepID=UPI0008118F0B|nr:PREDICTED: serine-rich adhesin for platelets isoform X2 [Rhagoletis zephyria]